MSGGEAAAAQLGEGSRVSHLEGPEDKRHDSEASTRRAWQG
jgi:hypothetical protein